MSVRAASHEDEIPTEHHEQRELGEPSRVGIDRDIPAGSPPREPPPEDDEWLPLTVRAQERARSREESQSPPWVALASFQLERAANHPASAKARDLVSASIEHVERSREPARALERPASTRVFHDSSPAKMSDQRERGDLTIARTQVTHGRERARADEGQGTIGQAREVGGVRRDRHDHIVHHAGAPAKRPAAKESSRWMPCRSRSPFGEPGRDLRHLPSRLPFSASPLTAAVATRTSVPRP
jgi:hypothetical protein